ncbi:Ig-like domain-containing protein [Cytobacillus oceanisediminis]|uniref:Ig-like domain-containing protein n=1 Tax=Cytobacillus oceanisediminis TaxID=665099 RepID=UPI001863F2E8|nr:Ig-like domain-containing protein [Cytobacillus oceanisediminis]QOK25900.1 Ig-like domain-containing protein [Cytobacillus oceanisediminis]
MAKKKAIKLAAASAVAASAFVAAAPAQTDAASNVAVEVSKAVTQMKKAYHTYSDVTAQGKFAPIADVYKEYNAAKKAYANAKAVVTKAGGSAKEAYLAQLDATYNEYIAKRVVTYIDAFNYATALEDKKEALEAALEEKEWEKAEELYHEISYELNTRTVILHRVYGQTARNLLVDAFKVEAQDTRDSITNEVSVKMYYDKAKDLVAEGKLEDAKKAMDHVADYVAKLDKDTDFGAYLLTQVSEVKAAYEAKLAPAVESVSAINLTTVVVAFNKEVDKASAINVANYTVNGSNPAANSVKLNDDKKSVTITVSALTNNANARVTVKDVTDTAGKKVTAFDELVYVSDTTAPTVASTSYSHAANLFTINFSENLATGATSLVKVFDQNNVDVTASTTITSPDAKTITVGTSALAAGKTYKVVMLGAKDLANNYFAGNKVETTFTTSKTDEVKPTVSSLDVRNNNTVRVTFSEAISVGAANKIAELKLDDAAVATTVTKVTSFSSAPEVAGEAVDVYGDGKTWDIKVKATGISGAAKVTLVNFADLEGNTQDAAFNKLATFAADTAAPVVSSTKVVGSKLYVSYDEEVAVASAPLAANSIQLVTPGNVLKDVSASATISVDATDTTGKTVVVDLGSNVATAGSYTVKLASGVVSDKATPANSKAYDHVAQFGGSADTGKPTLLMSGTPATIDASAIVQSADNKFVTVTFSEKVDASALNPANYLVNGVAVFENAIFVGDTNVVRLTLKANGISVSGDHQVTVSGVKDLAGNVMDSVTTIETLNENTPPVAQTLSILNGTTLEVTFSEGISDTGANADFEVKVNGAVVTPSNINVSGNKATFTVATLPTLTTPISVKVLDTNDLEDAAGNVVPTKTLSIN